MATIWKYPIPLQDEFTIQMPDGAQILYVQAQNNMAYMWARVLTEQSVVDRNFRLRGTGHFIDLDCIHIGSFMLYGGDFVFHLFEVLPGG